MVAWIIGGSSSENFVPDYGAPSIVNIDDTSSELAPAGVSGRLLSISSTSDSSTVYLCFGAVAAAGTTYNVKIPAGFNHPGLPIPAQAVNACCASGETATVAIAIATPG